MIYYVIFIDVFQHFKDLDTIFKEAFRMLKRKGFFAFTAEDTEGDDISEFSWSEPRQQDPLKLYRHSEGYIRNILHSEGFGLMKMTKFWGAKEGNVYVPYKAYLARKAL